MTIIGIETKITWVSLNPNASGELSWDRAQERSLAGGSAIYLVFDRMDIACDIEELIERISHEAVAEHLIDAGKNSANLEVSLEEPEFVWTVLCQAMTQKSVRNADTNWTDQDSEDQRCVTVRIDDRVINVECTKKDVIALSAIQSESYTLITGEFERVPSEDNEQTQVRNILNEIASRDV